MITDELKEELVSFTEEYQKALERQTETVLEYERLENDLKKLENELLLVNEIEEENSSETEDENLELIDLEAKLEKLKLELTYAESEVELEVRKTHPRATESHVKSLVGIDQNVHKLRIRIVDGKAYIKTKKSELQRESKENWEKQKQKRFQSKLLPENDKITNIKQKIDLARKENLLADDRAEFLRKKLEVLTLLVALVTEK